MLVDTEPNVIVGLPDSHSAVQVTVVRHSKSQEIELHQLLVGDVLCFGAGDVLPADGLIFRANDVK